MERVQFYPTKNLKELLEKEANEKNISISRLVVEVLQNHYNITPKPVISLSEATEKVLSEVLEYIKKDTSNNPFDLLTSSSTFANIEMTVEGKPATNRATIGKIFASRIGKHPFSNIQVYKPDGQTIARSSNKATLYIENKQKSKSMEGSNEK